MIAKSQFRARLLPVAAAVLGAVAGAVVVPAQASSHREAPVHHHARPRSTAPTSTCSRSYEAGPRRLRHADRQLPAAAGRRTAARTTSSWIRTRCTRSTSTTTATRGRHHLPVPLQQQRCNGRRRCRSAARTSPIPLIAGRRRSADRNAAALNVNETFTVDVVRGDRRSGTRAAVTNAAGGSATFDKPVDNIGTKTIPDYALRRQAHLQVNIPGCSDAGQGVRRPAQGAVRGQPRRDLRPGQRPGRGDHRPGD